MGYHIVGFLAEEGQTVKAEPSHVLGTVAELDAVMQQQEVDEIVLAVESGDDKVLLGILYSLYRYSRPVKVLAERFNRLSKIQIRTIRGIPLVDVTDNNFSPAEQNIKFFLDKVCSFVALTLLSPLFVYLAWRVKRRFAGTGLFPAGTHWVSGASVYDV